MTQNKSGVSTLLLRYQVAGQDQLLKANTSVTLSLKDAEKAAKELGVSIEKLQELSNASIAPSALQGGLLGRLQNGQSVLDGFRRDLERIQAAEAKSVQNNEKITEQLRQQSSYLQNRLKFAESDGLAGLRSSIGAPVSAGGSTGRSVTGTLTAVREGLISLPNVGYQNPAVVALRGIIPLAEKTGATFTDLGKALGVVGVAGAAAFVVFEGFRQQLAQYRGVLSSAFNAQKAYFEAVQSLGTDAALSRLEELKREQTFLQQQRDETRNSITSQFGEDALTDPLGAGRLKRGLLNLVDPQLLEQFRQQEAALQDNIQLQARLTIGLNNDAFAANDARLAMEAHTEALRRNREEFEADLRASTNTEADLRVRLAGIRRSGNSSQIQDELTSNADREAILRNFLIPSIEDLGLSAEETQERTKEYRDELNRLLQTDELLLSVVLPVVQAREAETKALQDQLAAIQSGISYYAELSAQIRTATVDQVAERLNGIEEERRAIAEFLPQLVQLAPTSVEAANALKEAQDSLTSLSLEYNDQITRILPAALSRARAELSADLAQLETERNTKFAEIDVTRLEKEADAAEKRSDAYLTAEEKRADSLNDLAEQQAERRARIEKKSNAEIANAIFARDAMAAYLAMQDREEQLDDLKTDAEKRQRELDKQFEKERQAADRNYERALRDAQQAADKARAAARRQYDVEYNERVTAYNQQLALLRNFVSQANAALSNLTVPSLSTGLVSGASGGTSTPPLPNSPYGVPPMNPYVGQTWTDAFGQLRVWNGNGWQIASAVRGYASGGVAQGLARINDGSGVESGMYNSNQLAVFTKPTRIFSAQQTQRLFGGGNSNALTINIPIQGSRLTKAQIKDIVDETIDETLPAEWDEAW